jgi:hypothetical protein
MADDISLIKNWAQMNHLKWDNSSILRYDSFGDCPIEAPHFNI